MKKLFSILFGRLLIVMSVGVIFISCNKDHNNTLSNGQNPDYNDTASAFQNTKKVLYIVVDGANGEVVQRLNLPNIGKLTDKGLFAWNSISGYEHLDTTLNASWANLMTGVKSSKTHGAQPGFVGNNFAQYPSFISNLKALNRDNMRIASFSSSSDFENYLASDADIHQSFAGEDAKVRDAIKTEISNPDARVVVGEFNSVYQAGFASNFDTASIQYKNAIQTFDEYLGEINSAMEARPNFKNERWLIIVTSTSNLTKASAYIADSTAFSDPKKNTFTIIANSDFQSQFLSKPGDTRGVVAWQTSAFRFNGTSTTSNRATVPDFQDIYEVPYGKGLTVEAKIKINVAASGGFSYAYPPFLSKTTSRYSPTAGWCFYRNGTNTTFYIGNGVSNQAFEMSGGGFSDNAWHTIAGVIYWTGNQLTGQLYVDGALAITKSSVNITSPTTNAPLTTAPLTLGPLDGSNIDMYIKDVRIWNIALPDTIISKYSCYPSELMPLTNPYLNNLVADFRLNEKNNTDNILHDYSTLAKNGTYTVGTGGIPTWSDFSEISNAICPVPDDNYYKGMINNIDLPVQIYRWLSVSINPLWGLDGKFWLINFKSSVTNTNS